jgi:hypothetical protein
MSQDTNRLAHLIATATNKELGTRTHTKGEPLRQDKAAAEAIAAEYVFIRRSELPTVEADPGGGVSVNNRRFLLCNPLESYRREALELLSAYEYAKSELEARATAARDKRRIEVLAELAHEAAEANNYVDWDKLSVISKRAVDRIIDLELAGC